ncbi:MAG: electron transport complex subunit RsxC [Eubacteriales bacterium]|nr:electron transport complex subunit RsxC [Eubacteriales bacterium]
MNESRFPVKPFRVHGGAKVGHHKHTSQNETVVFPIPGEIIIPMSQHIGKPCAPCVAVGDHVFAGQKIADVTAFVASPIHSSVSGTVKKIASVKMPNGSKCDAVFIESDGLRELSPDIRLPEIKSREDLLEAIKNSGAVGLGGAGFPTHVKINVTPDKADTLIINAAECEPYITSDHREILENSWNIMSGVYTLLEIMGFKRVIIGVEENKPDAIAQLTDIAESKTYDPDDRVKVLKLKTKYPQGAEKMLIYACTKRIVPAGKLPLDAGCVVMNITTLSFIANYLKTGIPLISKRITVDGTAVSKPCNLLVPIGTPIKDVLEFCGAENPKKILMGGPMMGTAISDTSLPVLKQNNAILAFGEDEASLPEETDCIHCGRCVESCPMKLQPVNIIKAAKRKDFEALEKLQVANCIECGCCTYNCPANRYITQQMRIAKAILRDSKQK